MGFPGGLVVRIQHFHCHGPGSIPGRGTEIPQAACSAQPKKKKGKQKLAFYATCTLPLSHLSPDPAP